MLSVRSLSLALVPLLIGIAAVLAMPERADAATYMCEGQVADFVGTKGADLIVGTDEADVIVARGGDDVIFSGGGDDVVCTGRGDDVVFAGEGDDRVRARRGDDFVYGGPGDDVLRGGKGDDVIEGGPGVTIARGQPGNDELWGTWCNPPKTMQHYCRWPDLTIAPAGYEELFASTVPLRLGSTGEAVLQLQTLLDDLGHDPGDIDGAFGASTEIAVKVFQDGAGLEDDGVVGTATRAALEDAAGVVDLPEMPADWVLGKVGVLKTGSAGAPVAVLQETLAGLGYDPGPVDGVYGAQTLAAVRTFQEANDLEVDGRTGYRTKRALFGDLDDEKTLRGGKQYDTCNSATLKKGCQGKRGLRAGAPWDADAAEEWRPLIAEVFTEWDLEEEIDRAVAVAACESLADPMITTPAGAGYYWIGLFQHTDRYWEARSIRADIAGSGPFDPRSNVTVAALLVRESIDGEHRNGAWGHFGCGKLLGFWPDD